MVSIAISTLQSAILCVLCAGHKILKAGSLSLSSSSFSTSHSYIITVINACKPNFSRILAQLTFKGGHLQNLVCLVQGMCLRQASQGGDSLNLLPPTGYRGQLVQLSTCVSRWVELVIL